MADTRTRRQKVKAMAEQAASPEEAAVAKAMLAKTATTPEERLEVIADDIRAEYGRGIESQFSIGRLLVEAAGLFPPSARHQGAKKEDGRNSFSSGSPFGDWFREQRFPFSQVTAWRLRQAAEREDEVRAYIASSQSTSTSGKDISPTTAIQYLNAGPKPAPVADGSEDDDAGELLPVTDATAPDPAYVALRTAAQAITGTEDEPKNAFLHMHVEDLAKSAGYIKALAAAYNAAKAERSA